MTPLRNASSSWRASGKLARVLTVAAVVLIVAGLALFVASLSQVTTNPALADSLVKVSSQISVAGALAGLVVLLMRLNSSRRSQGK